MLENTTRTQVGVVVGVTAFALGAVGGFFLSKEKHKRLYNDLAEQEIHEAKDFYTNLAKKENSPAELVEEAGYDDGMPDPITELTMLTKDYRSNANDISDEVGGPGETALPLTPDLREAASRLVDANVFEGTAEIAGWDYDFELSQRGLDPYIISHDEFMQNDPENDQITITYFEGDGVLSDERDEVIPDEEIILGKNNLKFGHGSKDNNIVYVRNEAVNTDFEVLRSQGKYAEQVLGFMHSEQPDFSGPRKFRSNE